MKNGELWDFLRSMDDNAGDNVLVVLCGGASDSGQRHDFSPDDVRALVRVFPRCKMLTLSR